MRISLIFPIIFLLALSSLHGQDTPVGWASLNGGTTGGADGEVVTITNRAELLTNVSGTMPRVLLIQDTIELQLYERVKVGSNKTIRGATAGAMIRYGGLEVIGNNVIVQNLSIGDFYDGDPDGKTNSTDCLTLYGQNIWIDHCWLWSGADGLLDVRSGNGLVADYITVSNVRFSDHNKVSLIGSSNEQVESRGHLRVTYDHCWWDGTIGKGLTQRLPRVRFGDVHVLNNYYEEISSYCIAARFESSVVVEGNFFRNSKNPHMVDDEDLGIREPTLAAIDNIYEATSGARTTAGDAFLPGDFYAYTPTPTAEVPAVVMNSAGPFNDPANLPPVAVTDTIDFTEFVGSVVIDAVANDSDPDGGDLRIARLVNDPPGLAVIRDNQITYVPASSATGIDTLRYVLVDTQGGETTGTILIVYEGASSATHFDWESGLIQVYPNPAHTTVTIELDAAIPPDAQLTVFDSRGTHVAVDRLSRSAAGSYSLNVAALPAGLYTVLVRTDGHAYGQRLLLN